MSILILLLIVMSTAVVLFLTGPRVQLDASINALPEQLVSDPVEHLRASESQYSDITPGAEKTIVWADENTRAQTEFAFVYLHGFSATRQESAPVPGNIAKRFNSNIFYARLAGNGRSDDALAQGSVKKWVNDVAEAMAIAKVIGRKTVVIGCSTGASLGWWAANQQRFADQISAMVFLSPNFGVADPRAGALLYPWGAQLARLIAGPYRESTPVSQAHADFWTNRYPIQALLPMMGMVKLAMRYPPSGFKVPIHTTYSRDDDTVSVEKIKAFCAQLPDDSETIEVVQAPGASQHVIVGNILAPENNERVEKSVVAFLERVLVCSAQPFDHHNH